MTTFTTDDMTSGTGSGTLVSNGTTTDDMTSGTEETCCSNSCTVLFGIPRVEGEMSFIKKIIKKFKFYLGTEISLNLDIYSCSSDVFPDLYLIIRR